MWLEEHPDGWHLRGEQGENAGPFATLAEASDYLDLADNRLQPASVPAPELNLANQPRGFWSRFGLALYRGLGMEPPAGSAPAMPPRAHHWTSTAGR
ncbi:MAG TPA: hypothetical protein VL096_09175 [Pirellulaceae bacterium]|nr:hypothetical protein [Pirellulaceae bacterium]